MFRRLIVNADDFGLTPGINRAVAELYDAGALRSATLMAAGPAFAEAVMLAKARPGLGVGCHVVLTDGTPVADLGTVRSLLTSEGTTLRPSLPRFVAALLSGRIREDEVEREAVAQIRRVQQAGVTVTHVDTHKHTHIFPAVLRPLLRAAARTGVRAVRNPFEQPWSFRLSNGSPARNSELRLLRPLQRAFWRQPTIRNGQIGTTEGTVGISATGHLDALTLRNLIDALPSGTWELVCHPGYNDAALDAVTTRLRATREVELHALKDLLGAQEPATPQASLTSGQQPSFPQLIHYGDLVNAPARLPATLFSNETLLP